MKEFKKNKTKKILITKTLNHMSFHTREFQKIEARRENPRNLLLMMETDDIMQIMTTIMETLLKLEREAQGKDNIIIEAAGIGWINKIWNLKDLTKIKLKVIIKINSAKTLALKKNMRRGKIGSDLKTPKTNII